MRRLPMYASELNHILNTLKMTREEITPEMLMKGDISFISADMSRTDAIAVFRIILQYTREIIYSVDATGDISHDQALMFMAHINSLYRLLEARGIDLNGAYH